MVYKCQSRLNASTYGLVLRIDVKLDSTSFKGTRDRPSTSSQLKLQLYIDIPYLLDYKPWRLFRLDRYSWWRDDPVSRCMGLMPSLN